MILPITATHFPLARQPRPRAHGRGACRRIAGFFAYLVPGDPPHRVTIPPLEPLLNRLAILHATPELSVNRFDHPPHEAHDDPEWEIAERWAIAFVRSGTFTVTLDGVRHDLVQGSVFITSPGLAFTCSHQQQCPDDVCLSMGFDAHAVADVEHAWARAGWAARVAPTPRLAYVQRRIARAADGGETFEMERWALAALGALDADAQDPGARTARAHEHARTHARGPYAVRRADLDAIVEACDAIDADPTRRCSVAERARDLGLTSMQLTHQFRRFLGVSPHQYVVRARLVTASALLDDGHSVSDSCWRSGFENLSHFCRQFQRTFGTRASAWPAIPLRERRRKVQALLTRHT